MLLSPRQLTRLANNPRVPESSRNAFRQTLAQMARVDHAPVWRNDQIAISDCLGLEALPGIRIQQPTGDPTAERAHDQLDVTLGFLSTVLRRDSVDDIGGILPISIHYSRSFSNGYWDGSRIVLGDGDGLMLLDFTLSLEFMGHEAFHAVTQMTANLEYSEQAGALNESISDMFGSIIRQWHHNHDVSKADWTIGSDIVGPSAHGLGWKCVRSLADPKSMQNMTRQPSRFREYVVGGDPHDNSGIPNNAMYLAAMYIGGNCWESLAPVLYATIRDPRCRTDINFSSFAWLMIEAAKQLDQTNLFAEAIREGWAAVEVIPSAPV